MFDNCMVMCECISLSFNPNKVLLYSDRLIHLALDEMRLGDDARILWLSSNNYLGVYIVGGKKYPQHLSC
jgi:hypothetical protein